MLRKVSIDVEELGPPARSMVCPAVVLGLTLIAFKAVWLEPRAGIAAAGIQTAGGTLISFLTEWLTVCASDVLFALLVGVIGQGLLMLVSRWPRLRRCTRWLLVGLCCLSVVYGVASVRMFASLGTWLTAGLISMTGNWRDVRSSVLPYLTPKLIAAALLVPLGYLLALWMTERAWQRVGHRAARWGLLIGLLVLGGWMLAARSAVAARQAGGSDEWRMVQNPHLVLINSFVRERFFAASQEIGIEFASDHTADFRLAAHRKRGVAPTPGLPRGPRNVLLITCESVGTQFLNIYGSPYRTWPRMERELEHAVVFDNHYAHVTNSANSLWTMALSCYPPLRTDEHIRKRAEVPGISLSNVLKPRGYRTAFIAGGHNDWANFETFIAARGFETIWDYRNAGVPELNSWGVEDRHLVDMVLRYIDQEPRDKPFFIHAWPVAPHHPYGPDYGMPQTGWENVDFLQGETKFGDMTWDLGRYLNALHELDKQLARLLDELRKRNLAEDTLVIITGDHGEAFGWPHKMFRQGGGVFEEYLRVPMIVWNPRLFKGAQRKPVLGGHIDLQPTILDFLGLPAQATWQGRSLFSSERTGRAYLFGSADQGILSVRQGDVKFVYNRLTRSERLFDLRSDPLEQVNVASRAPELCRELRQRIAAWAHFQQGLWK